MTRELGCGIIGCGGIAAVHLDAIRATPGVRVVGLHDRDPEALARMAANAGCAGHADVDDLLASAGLDFVLVATPPDAHAEFAVRALDRRIHVLCEKPVALDLAQARTMEDAARKSGARLIPAFCHRFAASTQCMRTMIAGGDIGEPLMVRNQFWGDSSALRDRWYTRKAVSGGGVVMDTLVHSIDLFHFLAGYTESGGAAMTARGFGLDLEDTAILTLRSESGVVGSLAASWAVADGSATLDVFGTRGSLSFDYAAPDRVEWRRKNGTRETIPVENAGERFANQMRHFAGLLGGAVTEPLVCERDAVESMRVVDLIYGRS